MISLAAVTVALSVAVNDTLVIRDVAVLPMTDRGVLQHRTVIVANGRVIAVGPAASVRVPSGTRVVEGQGKFLLPGLADMHVHLFGSAELPMFVGNGVLTVRDLNGSPMTLAIRDSVRAGQLVGPRLFVSGPMIAGAGIPWRNKVVPTTAAEAEAMVVAQKAAGYDQIKIYDGLSKETFAAAIAAARRLGMLSSGHIPQEVGFDGVLASGMTGLEHLDKTVFAVFQHNLDERGIPDVVAKIKRSGMWVTPTLASMIELALVGSGRFDSLMARPEAVAAPTELRDFWSSVTVRLKGNRQPPPGVRYNAWTDFQLRLAGELAAAGVPLLAGTDLPNAVLVPGYSLHEELAALVEAGLDPFRALEAATIAAARLVRQEADWGSVDVGKRANLLLVDENPLGRLRTLATPAGVVLEGRWIDRAELAAMRGAK